MLTLPPTDFPSGLPSLDKDSAEHGSRVARHIANDIRASQGLQIPFDEWMDRALYAPGLGYYVSGNTKFGAALPTGDFTTAPELTPLFGQTLAQQIRQILHGSHSTDILEFGAGSGALAAAVMSALLDCGVEANYAILEVSPELQARQKARLQPFGDRIRWISELPRDFRGCVLANEVLDAMPVKLFQWDMNGELHELYVGIGPEGFEWRHQIANPALAALLEQRMPPYPGYRSEINLRAEAWIRQMGLWLKQGAALLIDYGFPQAEYYHPQRAEGTLMCHFRHHSHAQPLVLAGLQDITAHVDFTAMADAALDAGMDVLGYTSQARFLLNAGLPDIMMKQAQQPHTLSAVQKLLSEAEMGELFKVLAIGRDLDMDYPLIGFSSGDRRDRL